MDNRICSHLKEYYKNKHYSKFSDLDITKITYDTIGDGSWAFNLAQLMLNTPGIISDSVMYKELELYARQIDTSDKRWRIIANVYGTKYPDPEYTIGIIGDSLTKVNESILGVLLNICDENETRIIDIATVAELDKRDLLNDTLLKKLIPSDWYLGDNAGMFYSKVKPFIESKNIKDTSISLQFLGYRLNDFIDTLRTGNFQKLYKFQNYCIYKSIKKFAINDVLFDFDIEIITLDSKIALIKAVCISDISDALDKMFRLKYGEQTYGSTDPSFYETVYGYHQSVWNFGTNCITLIDNTENVGKWDYPCGSNQKKWFHFYYKFHNVIVIYCDKQMYRRHRSLNDEMLQYREGFHQEEYKQRLDKQLRTDSICEIAIKKQLETYTNQI